MEMRRFEVFPNGIIISCSGTMGKIAIAPEDLKREIINQALLKLTPDTDKTTALFIKVYLESDMSQTKYFKDTSGAAIQNVASVKHLIEIPFPNISFSEQQEIVSRLNEEQEIINGNKKFIALYEQKIKDEINELWKQEPKESTVSDEKVSIAAEE